MIFAGLRPILGEAYAALRRQLLVDPHVLKDGSRSPDLVMDNPLSQSPSANEGIYAGSDCSH
ncbi:hypothetical protein OROMI_006921 [Orobanche minor]